jgi:hypothetical protein
LTLELAAVVHADDVRMKQRGGQVGFAVKRLRNSGSAETPEGKTLIALWRGSLGCSAR